MAGFEQTIIIGNVGRDVNLRYTQSGIPVADFSVAVTKTIGKGDSKEQRTKWYRVTCWRNLAETANQYVHKGMQVQIVGDVDVSVYTNKKGEAAGTLELTASNLQMLGSRNSNESSNEAPLFDDVPDNVGDIPF